MALSIDRQTTATSISVHHKAGRVVFPADGDDHTVFWDGMVVSPNHTEFNAAPHTEVVTATQRMPSQQGTQHILVILCRTSVSGHVLYRTIQLDPMILLSLRGPGGQKRPLLLFAADGRR